MIAWLDAQDAVFATCQEEVALPPLPAGAPAWLKADRAYQAAAHALYAGRTTEAAAGFGAISLDDGSPWRGMGPYLKARALRRAALAEPSPERFTLARVAIADLSRRPAGTFGRDAAWTSATARATSWPSFPANSPRRPRRPIWRWCSATPSASRG